jgi:hypothetical protein
MSSTVWARLVLSPATLHSVSGTTWCRCVTSPVAVPDRWPTALAPGYSRTVPTCLPQVVESLNTVANHCDRVAGLLCWPDPATCLPTHLVGI